MNKYSNLVLLLVLVGCISGLFQVKYSVQYLYKDVEELRRQLQEEKSSIHTLKAEWAFLNNPRRLKILAKRYLNLQEIQLSQIKEYGDQKSIVPSSENQIQNQSQDSSNIHQASTTNIPRKKTKWNFKDRGMKVNYPGKDKPFITISAD